MITKQRNKKIDTARFFLLYLFFINTPKRTIQIKRKVTEQKDSALLLCKSDAPYKHEALEE